MGALDRCSAGASQRQVTLVVRLVRKNVHEIEASAALRGNGPAILHRRTLKLSALPSLSALFPPDFMRFCHGLAV